MNECPPHPRTPPSGSDAERWAQFARSEIRLHWLFLSMAAVVLLASALMRSEGQSTVFLPGFKTAMPETCSSKRMFGMDCPGCGMTRAFIAISHGQWSRAWGFNPAAFLVYAFFAIQIPWHGIQIWRLKRQRPPLTSVWIYWGPILMVVALAISWIAKLCEFR